MITEFTPTTICEYCKLVIEGLDTGIDLSSDANMYDLLYIREKLALCSTKLETIANITFGLAQISLVVIREFSKAKSQLELKIRMIKDSEDYKFQARDSKTHFLEMSVVKDRELVEEWSITNLVLRETKEALVNYSQVIKRMDSTLRLHFKVLETPINLGEVNFGYTGMSPEVGEMQTD